MLCSVQKHTQKNPQKQTQKHAQTMMLIGGLGGHGSSGESHWVEGAEWKAGRDVTLEQVSPSRGR